MLRVRIMNYKKYFLVGILLISLIYLFEIVYAQGCPADKEISEKNSATGSGIMLNNNGAGYTTNYGAYSAAQQYINNPANAPTLQNLEQSAINAACSEAPIQPSQTACHDHCISGGNHNCKSDLTLKECKKLQCKPSISVSSSGSGGSSGYTYTATIRYDCQVEKKLTCKCKKRKIPEHNPPPWCTGLVLLNNNCYAANLIV